MALLSVATLSRATFSIATVLIVPGSFIVCCVATRRSTIFCLFLITFEKKYWRGRRKDNFERNIIFRENKILRNKQALQRETIETWKYSVSEFTCNEHIRQERIGITFRTETFLEDNTHNGKIQWNMFYREKTL